MKLRLLLSLALALGARAADVSISALPAISSVTGTTILPVVDTAGTPTTKKATVAQLITGLPAATGANVGTMSATDKARLDAATASSTISTLMARDSSGNSSVNQLTASIVTGLAAPVSATDAANKSYVDAAAAGLSIKTPTVAATTANVTLSGGAPTTIDGFALSLNDRVLVKSQTDPKENGIYFVATLGTGANGTWTRTTDADTGAELITGSYVYVFNGTVSANSAWVMTTVGTITIGSSNIVWAIFSQIGQIQASSIIGQIVNAQIADAAVSFTKFANTIEPVSIVSSLPSPSGYTGPKALFNTGDAKLYRYTGSAFVASVPSTDLTGTITTTQIADNSISTPKLMANSVTATQIAAGSIAAGDIQANAVTSGTIAAAAVSTTELAAGAVTSAKILAGTIISTNIAALTITGANIAAGTLTADKLSVTTLSAITANIGTITAGTITSSGVISLGSGTAAVSISSSGLSIAAGRVTLNGDGTNPWVRVTGTGSYSGQYIEINGHHGEIMPLIQAVDGSAGVTISPQGLTMSNSKPLIIVGGSTIQGSSGGAINLFGADAAAISIIAGEDVTAGTFIGYLKVQVNNRAVKIPFYNL